MPDRVRNIFEHVRQNIGDYVSIMLGILFGVLGLTGIVHLEIVIAGMLVVLSLLSLSNISERRREIELQHRVEKLIRITESGTDPSPDRLFYDVPISDDISLVNRSQREIWYLEADAFSGLQVVFEPLQDALNRGVKFRLIKCENNETLLRQCCFRANRLRRFDTVAMEYQLAEQLISNLRKNVRRPNLIEVHEVPIASPYSAAFYDPMDTEHGLVIITFAGFWAKMAERPEGREILIRQKTDPRLFQRFLSEFEMLWRWNPEKL